MNHWYELITIHRRRQGLTITALAKKAGISRNYLSLIENDKALPTFKVVVDIFKALGFYIDIKLTCKEEDTHNE
jgi:transcriptional regulator with XRE-family HTH domain